MTIGLPEAELRAIYDEQNQLLVSLSMKLQLIRRNPH